MPTSAVYIGRAMPSYGLPASKWANPFRLRRNARQPVSRRRAVETGEPTPRDGALILSEVRSSTLTIACAPCGRRGRCNVDRLMAERGDAKLTDLLGVLADCPNARSASV